MTTQFNPTGALPGPVLVDPRLGMAQPMALPRPMPVPRPKRPYEVVPADSAWAVVVLLIGFLFWNWLWPRSQQVSQTRDHGGSSTVFVYMPSISVLAFAVVLLACSFGYFASKKMTVSRGGLVGAGLILLGAIPFALYDTTPVHIFAGMFLLVGYVVWHAYAARTAISPNLGGLSWSDVVNQAFVVPVANAGAWFSAARGLTHQKKRPAQLIIAVVSVIVALPVLGIVLALLVSADSRFGAWVETLNQWGKHVPIGTFVWQFCFGVPVALYGFALLYGNANRRHTDHLTPEVVSKWTTSLRRVRTIALVAPVTLLCLFYAAFLAAIGSYLLPAFAGQLPAGFTYAGYARQGFFQLAAVAGINLGVLAFMYLSAKRTDEAYPPAMRILGATLTGLTLLLIVTAMSKMFLYVGQFGLTQLRLYTMWFMAVLFIFFALLGVWHVRRFRVAGAIAWIGLLSFLGLLWSNSDGIIADYNTNQFLSGRMHTIDVKYMADNLSDAAIPALTRLQAEADPATSARVTAALATRAQQGSSLTPPGDTPWPAWNLQLHR